MSPEEVILPLLVLLGFISLSLFFIYISAHIAMKRFGLTKKAVFRNMIFLSLMVLVSNLVYGGAEHLGMGWLWFSNKWVFSVLFGVVSGFACIGAKRLKVTSG
ncbi:hypothetical protein [Bartonella gabonensis]|uniref:hypothetical protein n=1 Tax=Bartonella gabonensis TaxID=2699889 RepID=UPI00158DA588|nr:hypothetical protein [Bartonella gabonensis]